MSARKPLLSRDDIRRLLAEEGDRWPPFLSPERFAEMLGLKSRKTIYAWIDAGRLDGAVRKRGKHNLIIRDRAIDQLFNGPDWTN
jgi:hypothetical protein